MKQNKNYPINLAVTREGEPDAEYYAAVKRIERRQAALNVLVGMLSGAGHIAAQIARKSFEGIGHLVFLVHLDFYDYANGTHLRDEYFAEKRKLQSAALRSQFTAW